MFCFLGFFLSNWIWTHPLLLLLCMEQHTTTTNEMHFTKLGTKRKRQKLEPLNVEPWSKRCSRHKEFSGFCWKYNQKKKERLVALERRRLWKHHQTVRTRLLFTGWWTVFAEAACQPGLVRGLRWHNRQLGGGVERGKGEGRRRRVEPWPATPVHLNHAPGGSGSKSGKIKSPY